MTSGIRRAAAIVAAIIIFCVIGALYIRHAQRQSVSEATIVAQSEMSAQTAAVNTVPSDIQPPAIEGAPPMPEAAEPAPVGGAFALVDHTGNAVSEKSWPGKYKLVFFGFTHCPDICPAAMQKLSAVMDSYDPAGAKLVPLFITVDPARDTSAVLTAYIAPFNKSIVGLTGTEEQIKAAEESYKVYAARAASETPEDYMMDHSAYIFLMSPDDKLLEIFDSAVTAEGMIEKIRLHLQ